MRAAASMGALDDVVGLGLAGAAIGIDGHGVGDGATDIDGDCRYVVDAALRRRGGDHGGAWPVAREIGAKIGDHLHVQRQRPAGSIERQPGRRGDVAALGAHDELLGAIGQPAHRPAETARREQQHDPFGIEEVLHAEAAADVGRMHAHAIERQLEDELGELAADAVHALPRQLEVHRAGRRIVARDAGPRLDGGDDDTVVHHLDLDDVRGALHGRRHRIAVAALGVIDEISRRFWPERRRAGRQGRDAVDHRIERLVIDLDGLGRGARDVLAVGHHEGHRIADMADAAVGQRRPRRHDHRLHRGQARHVAQPLGREVGVGVDGMHAGKRRRRRNVDALDQRMGMRRAQHVAVQAICNRYVGDVATLPDEKSAVLEAPHRAADHLLLTAIAHAAPPDKLPPKP